MLLGGGGTYCTSKMQRINTQSSTEAELVGVDDVMPQIVWTRNFLLAQGYRICHNIVYQDNQSIILLPTRGMATSLHCTKHINCCFYSIATRIEKGAIEVQYCPTNLTIGDFFTKPLQGSKFLRMRRIIMNEL